jgi:phosphate transport system substrate-binding protein
MKFAHRIQSAAVAGCLSALLLAPGAQAAEKLNGSGASFPFPIYSAWFKQFSQDKKVKEAFNSTGARVDYQAKGSGAGIKDLQSGAVDFAASDAAMNDEEIAAVDRGVVLLPMTAGEVVLAYNLKGVDELKLPRDVYPEIFAGKITRWNDPKIAAANPGTDLPDEKITVVVRSDSSGTSYVFTGHLSEIYPKNDGITAQVQQIPGAIGYIEYGYAKLTKWKQVALLENKAGKFVAPGPESGAAAIASAEFPGATLPGTEIADLRAWVYDPAGEAAYPIATMTWMLFYADYDDEKLKVIQDLIAYCTSEQAQGQADSLGYVPLPDAVIEKVKEAAKLIQ